MNSKRTILAILTLMTLTFAGFALAQTTAPDPNSGPGMNSNPGTGDNTNTVVGTVVSFNDNRLVVATSGGERTFLVDQATVRPTTLSVNLPVIVAFATESGGERAVRVTENTHQSAASETPGGSTTGGSAWPGAANKDNDVNSNSGEGTNTADTTASGSSYGTTGTTDTMQHDTTGSMNDTTGSSYGSTGSTGTTGSSMNDTSTGTTGTTDTSASAYGSTTGTQATATTTGSTAGQHDDHGGIDSSGYQKTLPATGSDLPLAGLIGLLAFAAAAVLRLTR